MSILKTSPIYSTLSGSLIAPVLFFISPAQLWLGSFISKVNSRGRLEEDWLPQFSQSAAHLREVFSALNRHNGGVQSFVMHLETGGMLLIGGLLELMSAASSLGAPLVLHRFLKSPGSASLAWALIAVTLLACICGRARDEVCRVHSAWMECMLRSTIFDKSLRLSSSARTTHPPAKIISINSVDVGFLTNYVLKIHDVWSAPLQIIGIAMLTIDLMGWTGCVGFALVALIFAGQTRIGKHLGQVTRGYVRHNDNRLGAYRDMLSNIKSVKAGALEGVFQQKITAARIGQLLCLRDYLMTSFAVFTAVNQTTPYLAACAAFLAYAIAGAELTADVVFPCLAYFQLLYQPVTQASLAISRQFSVLPSLARIRDLLNAPETYGKLSNTMSYYDKSAISFESASFEWAEDEGKKVSLRIGDLEVPRGGMTAIIGRNGAGKSSLLQAILGEMTLVKGALRVNGTVAYCSQEPWIMSGTLRDNIVFNSSKGYEAARYQDIVKACGLEKDFANVPGGAVAALVGEAGSNLSGGQRARVSLARALYSDADILLLDDPLSAVDAHVRSDIFESLRRLEKTVVLVTLHTTYISRVDHVVVLEENRIRWAGSSSTLFQQSWAAEYLSYTNDSERLPYKEKIQGEAKQGPQSIDTMSADAKDKQYDSVEGVWAEEDRARGTVQWAVVSFFVKLCGGVDFAMFALPMTFSLTASKVMAQYWFVWWIADSLNLSQHIYMSSFLGLILLQGVFTVSLGMTLVTGSLKAAELIHDRILENLLTAPLWFYHQTPTGRILNRLSSDVEAMDSKVLNAVDGLLAAGTTMFASIIIVASSGFALLAVVVPFIAVVGFCLQRFRVTAREVQRLDAVLQSPALSIVTESLRAPSSIKAYGAGSFLVNRHGIALDLLAATKICRSSLDTWVTFRAELAAALVLAVLSLLTVRGTIPHVSASLALATATNLARNVYLLAWAATDLEIQLNAVERLQNYHDQIPSEEKSRVLRGAVSYDAWSQSCTIDVQKAYLKYKTRKTPALDKVTLKIEQGEKVGLVGRTASGKSTLISVVARLVDVQEGHVLIGGTDIKTISPQSVRRTVVTLPQESLIFRGTVRYNVDPNHKHKDRGIWDALETCQLGNFLQSKYGQQALDHQLSSEGSELSAGHRQLLCAARVLLENPAILLVDEASANVDFASDDALQRAWQSLPRGTTMINIAHRASSLAWMDRIIVMDNGKVVEDGSPATLLRSPQSYYGSSIRKDGTEVFKKALETAEYWDKTRHNR